MAEKVRKLRIKIMPSWTIANFDDTVELPEDWDNWSQKEQEAYALECVMEEISDWGYHVVEEDN